MKSVFLVVFVFCFCSHLARADSTDSPQADTDIFPANCFVPTPDINDWHLVSTSQIRIINDSSVGYFLLGFESKYYNPDDDNEFVLVFNRHIDRLFSIEEASTERHLWQKTMAQARAQEEEKEELDKLSKESDPFLYVRWRVKRNWRIGGDDLDSDVDIWFLRSDGGCLITKNQSIKIQFTSASVNNGQMHNIFAGVKYQVGEHYHILKIRRELIMQALERGR